MEPDFDQDLLKRARLFEEQALAEIYDRWSAGLYRYSMRLLGDTNLAEECVSETYRRFLEILRDGRGPTDYLQAYLYRMAHNWITDHYRRNPIHTTSLDAEVEEQEGGETTLLVDQNIERQQLRSALLKLTSDQRQVILLKFVEGWTNEAIALAVKKPVGAVKSLQHRALDSLRRFLTQQERTKNEEERTVAG
jgi:RNA polymerase sigma-70 factor (ECF subfamily)